MRRLAGARRTALLIVAVASAGLGLAAYATDLFNRTELDTVDARFSVRGEQPPPDDIVVVEIDDATFGDLQKRWPLPRSLHAELIDRLREAGVQSIVYDVQFTEPTKVEEDNALITAVARAGRPVVLASEEVNERGETSVFGGEEVLRQIGARAGNSAFDPDPGGVFRRVQHSTDGLESLSVAAVEETEGREVDTGGFPEDGAWIDYAGPPLTLDTVSFSDVLSEKVKPGYLRDRIAVVGVSSPVVQDVHPVSTSGEELMSGPEIQANAIETVREGLPLKEAPWPLAALVIAVMGMLVPVTGLRWRPLPAAGIGVAAAALYLVLAQLAFDGGLILPLVDPLLTLAIAIVGTLAVHYVLEAFERQRVRDTFSRFVPEQVVGQVLERTDEDLRLGGVRQVSTVLFSDLRGFTSFSESLPPDRVVEVLNNYLDGMTEAIMGHGGTLVAYMGDGIMAVFGAPIEQQDHADRALAAAREMLDERLPAFNDWLRSEGLGDGFGMGVGLNSGPVMSGQVGSRRRVEYTTIGDTTNTAARLEGMTKGTPHQLFVAASTKDLLSEDPGLELVDRLEVRGREEAIEVWTLRQAG